MTRMPRYLLCLLLRFRYVVSSNVAEIKKDRLYQGQMIFAAATGSVPDPALTYSRPTWQKLYMQDRHREP